MVTGYSAGKRPTVVRSSVFTGRQKRRQYKHPPGPAESCCRRLSEGVPLGEQERPPSLPQSRNSQRSIYDYRSRGGGGVEGAGDSKHGGWFCVYMYALS